MSTTDSVDLVFKTNNTEKMRILSNGNVGIGTAALEAKLYVSSGMLRIANQGDETALLDLNTERD